MHESGREMYKCTFCCTHSFVDADKESSGMYLQSFRPEAGLVACMNR